MNAPDPITPPDGASLVASAPIRDFGPSLTNRKHRPEHIQALAAPTYGDHPPANLLATAEALDIDADAIKRGVIGEMREKAKAKAKPKATKPSAQRSDPSTAAQAKDKDATAAPAGAKERTPRAKKPKAKADPAPALPAKEPASPANTAAATSLLPAGARE